MLHNNLPSSVSIPSIWVNSWLTTRSVTPVLSWPRLQEISTIKHTAQNSDNTHTHMHACIHIYIHIQTYTLTINNVLTVEQVHQTHQKIVYRVWLSVL